MQDRHDMLIHWLRRLNWKERYYLVDHVLGTDGFKLSPEFRKQLGAAIEFDVPPDAFAAMDYHLDWLYAAIKMSTGGISSDGHWDNAERIATGTQLDTDLLVVFRNKERTDIVMVEAKVKGSWDNRQMRKKVSRLTEVFGEAGNRWPSTTPHFVLMSPRPERRLDTSFWPSWMMKNDNPLWIGLPLPERLSSLYRADSGGNSDSDGDRFAVKTTRLS